MSKLHLGTQRHEQVLNEQGEIVAVDRTVVVVVEGRDIVVRIKKRADEDGEVVAIDRGVAVQIAIVAEELVSRGMASVSFDAIAPATADGLIRTDGSIPTIAGCAGPGRLPGGHWRAVLRQASKSGRKWPRTPSGWGLGTWRASEGPEGAAPSKPRPGDCIHLGVVLERTDARGVSCACVGRWLRRCDLHGSCHVNDRLGSHRNCLECDDYEAEGAEGVS